MTDTGTYICYVEKRFGEAALAMIGQANAIIEGYEKKGYSLTVRQLYYQFVSRGLFENVVANYNKLGEVISDARLAGLVSWTAIEDRGRNLMGLSTLRSPAEAIKKSRDDYRRDLWDGQACRPEVWVEKQALEGVVGGICSRLRVDFFATKGYNSQSEMWRAGRRFAARYGDGQRPVVLHFGDHDPSGIDMTRDASDRLALFAGVPVPVIRVALNMDQVEQYAPPPNPAKMTDSRAADYVAKYGDESWELDALPPDVIENLIARHVARFRDEEKWEEALSREAEDKDALDRIVENLTD